MATPKKPRKKRHPAALPVAAARAALDRATKDIKTLQKSASRNSWAIGRRLAQVAELDLHKSRGYSSIEAYAEKVLRLTRDTAFLYMRVAQAFSETMAATYGTEKLDRALRYISATPEDEKPSDIPKLKFRIPSEDGKKVQNKSFEYVTIPDLHRATEHERRGSKRGKRRVAAAAVHCMCRITRENHEVCGASCRGARLPEAGDAGVGPLPGPARVPKDPASTSWKRRARWHQACWREQRGFPIGAQPYAGGPDSTPVGSRLALDFATSTGANFITPAAHDAARTRLASATKPCSPTRPRSKRAPSIR